jgi:hypothetical protein
MKTCSRLLASAFTAFVACSHQVTESSQTQEASLAQNHGHHGRANPHAPFLDEDEAIAAGNALGIGSAVLEGPSTVEVRSVQSFTLAWGDRPFKLSSGTTSGYRRYVKSLWRAPWRGANRIGREFPIPLSSLLRGPALALSSLWAPRAVKR